MKRKIRHSIQVVLFMVCMQQTFAQQPPFYDEIQNFKKQDSEHRPPANAILLTGSSSFRKWTDVQDYFPGYTIVNRGFGGSTLPDVIRYAADAIYPYKPKQVLIYCGDNDLASSDTVKAETVLSRFQQLFSMIRTNLPKANIVFVSIKPSPSRQRLLPEIEKANSMIKTFLQKQPNTAFADVFHPMLNADGSIKKEIFLSDNLHMNAQGYALWQKVLQPYLLK
jgi:lysophospholipase L1-like esterase